MASRDDVAGETCVALGADQRRFDAYPTRELHLGELAIRRALPIREHRLVGPWCFLDRFGPLSFSSGRPMDVAPHPHIGLQTVSWLLEGDRVPGRPPGRTAADAGRAAQSPQLSSLRRGGYFFLPIRVAMSLTTRSQTSSALA